jgi:hypothetical protein
MACDPASGQCVATPLHSTCVPGGGSADTDCALEWVVHNPANPTGITSATQLCRQGDTTCDFDISPKRCTFRVRVCIGAHDVSLPSCTPPAVAGMTLAKPPPSARIRPLLDAIAGLAPSTRSGRGGKRITFSPPDATSDDCTPLVGVEVRLGKTVSLKTSTTDASAKDADRLRLKCVRRLRPAG